MKHLRQNWGLFILIAGCAIVYQPWSARHLPLTDFGIFLAARGSSHDFFSQLAGITSYYVAEGRACLLTFLYLALGSAAFGTWAPAWHWTYFILNSAVLVLAWNLFVRLGVNRVCTFIVLALWSVMGPTAELYLRPAGEAIALIFFLIALGAGLNFSSAANWRARIGVISVCAAGIILSKETLVVLLPAGWLFSRLIIREGEWRLASWARRDTWLLVAVTSVVVALGIPIAYVASHARTASYAGQYGLSAIAWSTFWDRLEISLIPAAPRLHWLGRLKSDPAWIALRVLPNVAWIAILLGSAVATARRKIVWPAAIGLLWVIAGVLAYLPWPGQGAFYMMPFALGTMFLAAHALNGTLSSTNANRRVLSIVAGALIIIASVEARSSMNQVALRAALNAGVIDAIARHPDAKLLVAAVPQPLNGTGGWANHLRGFARVDRGVIVHDWRDERCDPAKKALERSGAVVVSMDGGCNELDNSSLVIEKSTSRYTWPYIWKPIVSRGKMYVAFSSPTEQTKIASNND